VYDGLVARSYFAILDEAKKLDLPVVGHLPTQLVFVKRQMLASVSFGRHGICAGGRIKRWSERLHQAGVWINLPSRRPSVQRTSPDPMPGSRGDNTMMLDTFSQEARGCEPIGCWPRTIHS